MQTAHSPHHIILEENDIWLLTKKRDFTSIIAHLLQQGIKNDDLGETLLALANKAQAEGEHEAAKEILYFLTESLEDQAEAPPLFKLIGDIYSLEKNYEKAREFYGKLPLTLQSIKLCFDTYLPSHDIEGLLVLRNSVVERITSQDALQVHALTDKYIQMLALCPEIMRHQFKLYQQNMEHLAKLPPFSSTPNLLKQYQNQVKKRNTKRSLIKISNAVYAQQNNVWNKVNSDYALQEATRNALTGGDNLLTRANSPKVFFSLVNALNTATPQFIKFECRIVIDFELLQEILFIYDISPLLNCNYVIRFINEQNLNHEITNLLLNQNRLLPNRTLFLDTKDKEFYTNKIKPTITRCKETIMANIQLLKQQLFEIFHDDYHKELITKIKQNKKLRILFQTSRFTSYMQYSTRDMAEGFHQLGHETFIETEMEDAGHGIRADVCMKNLIDFCPDIIFNINHFRYEYSWIPKSIPYVTWVQDPMAHIFNIPNQDILKKQDYIYSISSVWQERLNNQPAYIDNKVDLLPMMVNPSIYHPLNCKKKYDVTHIAHLNISNATIAAYKDTPDNSLTKEEFLHRDFIKYIETIPLTNLTRYWLDEKHEGERIWKNFSSHSPKTARIMDRDNIHPFLRSVLPIAMRCKILKPFIENDIPLALFGNGWDKHPWFSHIAHGPITNGKALNKIQNETKINLNISTALSFHPKVGEVFGSGSFLLTREIGEADLLPIDSFFEKDSEVVFFQNSTDMIEKTLYFLENETEREEIACRCHKKMIRQFSFSIGAQRIIQDIGSKSI